MTKKPVFSLDNVDLFYYNPVLQWNCHAVALFFCFFCLHSSEIHRSFKSRRYSTSEFRLHKRENNNNNTDKKRILYMYIIIILLCIHVKHKQLERFWTYYGKILHFAIYNARNLINSVNQNCRFKSNHLVEHWKLLAAGQQ